MDSSFTMTLSLQKICLVKISSILIDKELLFKHKSVCQDELHPQKMIFEDPVWKAVISSVVKRLSSLPIPFKLRCELAAVIMVMCQEVMEWERYLLVKLKLNCESHFKLYWTPFGRVDRVKVLKYWEENNLVNEVLLYELNCEYCNENRIKLLHRLVGKFVPPSTYIIAYWKHLIRRNFDGLVSSIYQAIFSFSTIYEERLSREMNMLHLSVSEGYDIAAVYFWNKISESEKKEQCVCLTRLALKRYELGVTMKTFSIGYGSTVEICLFLIGKLNIEERLKIFKDQKDIIIRFFLDSWQCHEFLIQVLNQLWPFLQQEDFDKLIFRITSHMMYDHQVFYSIDYSKYQKILSLVWGNSPDIFKHNLGHTEWGRILSNLMKVRDIYNLQLMVKDLEVGKRSELVLQVYSPNNILHLISHDYFVFESFIDEECDRQGNRFLKNRISKFATSVCYYFIEHDKFDLAQRYIDWQFENGEKKSDMKKLLVTSFISHKTDYKNGGRNVNTLVKLVFWVFDNFSERNKFIKDFILSKAGLGYCLEHVILSSDSDGNNEFQTSFIYNFLQTYNIRQVFKEKLIHLVDKRWRFSDHLQVNEEVAVDRFLKLLGDHSVHTFPKLDS